tara:strand:+ start:339 stop:602 length:264 start_codon:yes stop_codon:yes gene_type:complete
MSVDLEQAGMTSRRLDADGHPESARCIRDLIVEIERLQTIVADQEEIIREFLNSGVEHTTRSYQVMQIPILLLEEARELLEIQPEPS